MVSEIVLLLLCYITVKVWQIDRRLRKDDKPQAADLTAAQMFWLLVGLLLIVGLPILVVGSIWWAHKSVPGASFPVGPSIFLAIVIGFFWWLSERA